MGGLPIPRVGSGQEPCQSEESEGGHGQVRARAVGSSPLRELLLPREQLMPSGVRRGARSGALATAVGLAAACPLPGRGQTHVSEATLSLPMRLTPPWVLGSLVTYWSVRVSHGLGLLAPGLDVPRLPQHPLPCGLTVAVLAHLDCFSGSLSPSQKSPFWTPAPVPVEGAQPLSQTGWPTPGSPGILTGNCHS